MAGLDQSVSRKVRQGWGKVGKNGTQIWPKFGISPQWPPTTPDTLPLCHAPHHIDSNVFTLWTNRHTIWPVIDTNVWRAKVEKTSNTLWPQIIIRARPPSCTVTSDTTYLEVTPARLDRSLNIPGKRTRNVKFVTPQICTNLHTTPTWPRLPGRYPHQHIAIT